MSSRGNMNFEDDAFRNIAAQAGTIMPPAEIEAREQMGDEAYEELSAYIKTNQSIGIEQGKARTRYINSIAYLYESAGDAITMLANKYLGS